MCCSRYLKFQSAQRNKNVPQRSRREQPRSGVDGTVMWSYNCYFTLQKSKNKQTNIILLFSLKCSLPSKQTYFLLRLLHKADIAGCQTRTSSSGRRSKQQRCFERQCVMMFCRSACPWSTLRRVVKGEIHLC